MSRIIVIAGWALVWVIESAVLVRRIAGSCAGAGADDTGQVTATASQSHRPFRATLDQSIRISGLSSRTKPEEIPLVLQGETGPVTSTTEMVVHPELQFAPEFALTMRCLKAQGGDTWLLAHMANTQFERQWASWQRRQQQLRALDAASADDQQAILAMRDAIRERLISSLLGSKAVARLKFKDWIRWRRDEHTATLAWPVLAELYRVQ